MNLLFSPPGPVLTITLNRPERRNALSVECMEELIAALDRIAADSTVRVVVLAAAGKVFCSGHDLSEMVDRHPEDYRRIFDICARLMTRLQSIPQPVIARVRGLATAAGCQLVATCDLAIASTEASFATPGVRIGLFCSTPMVALTRAIGRKRAMEMLLTGRVIGAKTAADWGLVNACVEPADLDREVDALATRIAEASGFVVGVGKQAFYSQIDLDRDQAYAFTKEVMSANALAADAREGITAFLEKRAPCWRGR
ncbi:MAG TPA: enoyl-CoA hydratase [Bryobacteraceae bacterium]|nr:enoyl-CoA hydratase [Bryobacteraceae bacterium]